MNYKFVEKDGHCPECVAFGKRYYIRDMHIGAGKYSYALMSEPAMREKPMYFRDKAALVSYFAEQVIDDELAVDLLLDQWTIYQVSSGRILVVGGTAYSWIEESKTLRKLTEPKQETGYCDTYWDCLHMAKKILSKLEASECGNQM